MSEQSNIPAEQLRSKVINRNEPAIIRIESLERLLQASPEIGSEVLNMLLLEEDGELLSSAIRLAGEYSVISSLQSLLIRGQELLEEPTQVPVDGSDEQVKVVMAGHDASFLAACLEALWKVAKVNLWREEGESALTLIGFYCTCMKNSRRFVVAESTYGLVVLYASFPFLRKEIMNKVGQTVARRNFLYAGLVVPTFLIGCAPSNTAKRAAAIQLQVLMGWHEKYIPPPT